ncbi:MAG: DUF86 domain-containing protein [Pseudomonadota bacterium]
MTGNRLADYLEPIRQAATVACVFVSDMTRADFLVDRRTQQAVVMNPVIIGEAATRIMDPYPKFADAHAEVPWRSMRGMRNRIAHGDFEIDFDVVWDTFMVSCPKGSTHWPNLAIHLTLTHGARPLATCNTAPPQWPDTRVDFVRAHVFDNRGLG